MCSELEISSKADHDSSRGPKIPHGEMGKGYLRGYCRCSSQPRRGADILRAPKTCQVFTTGDGERILLEKLEMIEQEAEVALSADCQERRGSIRCRALSGVSRKERGLPQAEQAQPSTVASESVEPLRFGHAAWFHCNPSQKYPLE